MLVKSAKSVQLISSIYRGGLNEETLHVFAGINALVKSWHLDQVACLLRCGLSGLNCGVSDERSRPACLHEKRLGRETAL